MFIDSCIVSQSLIGFLLAIKKSVMNYCMYSFVLKMPLTNNKATFEQCFYH